MHIYSKSHDYCGKLRRCAGVTLVEVICAIAVGAIMISVLLHGINNGFGILRVTRDDMRATQILMQKTEAFRLYTWTQLTNCQTANPTFREYYYPSGTNSGTAGTEYYGTLSLLASATNLSSDASTASYRDQLHLITITVNWTNTSGGHTRQMQTMVAKNGLQNYVYSHQ